MENRIGQMSLTVVEESQKGLQVAGRAELQQQFIEMRVNE
jgi:hypothetical protein